VAYACLAWHGRLADVDRHLSATTGEEGPWARLERLQGEGRDLDRILEITNSGAKTRDDTTAQVIAGRLTLRQAAAVFLAADAGLPPQMVRAKLDRFPGKSDEERAGWWVIAAVADGLRYADPLTATVILSRLELELQHDLRKQGTSPPNPQE
jgi:hypothetical protein